MLYRVGHSFPFICDKILGWLFFQRFLLIFLQLFNCVQWFQYYFFKVPGIFNLLNFSILHWIFSIFLQNSMQLLQREISFSRFFKKNFRPLIYSLFKYYPNPDQAHLAKVSLTREKHESHEVPSRAYWEDVDVISCTYQQLFSSPKFWEGNGSLGRLIINLKFSEN